MPHTASCISCFRRRCGCTHFSACSARAIAPVQHFAPAVLLPWPRGLLLQRGALSLPRRTLRWSTQQGLHEGSGWASKPAATAVNPEGQAHTDRQPFWRCVCACVALPLVSRFCCKRSQLFHNGRNGDENEDGIRAKRNGAGERAHTPGRSSSHRVEHESVTVNHPPPRVSCFRHSLLCAVSGAAMSAKDSTFHRRIPHPFSEVVPPLLKFFSDAPNATENLARQLRQTSLLWHQPFHLPRGHLTVLKAGAVGRPRCPRRLTRAIRARKRMTWERTMTIRPFDGRSARRRSSC